MTAAVTAAVLDKLLLLAYPADLRKPGECIKFRENSDDGTSTSVFSCECGFDTAYIFFCLKSELFQNLEIERGGFIFLERKLRIFPTSWRWRINGFSVSLILLHKKSRITLTSSSLVSPYRSFTISSGIYSATGILKFQRSD